MQGVRILRNEAYLLYVAMTKDEAQRRRWTFYEAVNFGVINKQRPLVRFVTPRVYFFVPALPKYSPPTAKASRNSFPVKVSDKFILNHNILCMSRKK